ncbi:MAG: apolipoprotein N-acyltransferase [Endomicrobia bacterium]|nr:apolipoprotein N-acyltransferase [Endomicrobiia bacterium]
MKQNYKNIILCVITGFLAAFAFPKINLFFLMWIAFIPLMYVIFRSSQPLSFVYAFIAGFVFNLQANFWLINTIMLFSYDNYGISIIAYVFFCLYFAFYWGIWGLFSSIIKKYCTNTLFFVILSACLWVALEYVRTYILGNWPWLIIAYSQYKIPQLIQIAEFTGVYGVSFAIIFINGLLYFGIFEKKRNYLFYAAAVFAAILVFGIFRYNAFQNFGEGKEFKAAAVQANVEQYKKLTNEYRQEMFAGLKHLAEEVSKINADLVLWAESEIINFIPSDKESFEEADKIAKISGGINIIGAPHLDENERLYNAVFYFDGSGGYAAMHLKNHLVPFGEYMPYGEIYSKFVGIPNINDDITGGKDTNVFTDGSLFIGPLICSENLFPDIVRRFVLSGAKVLTNHTNDAWFFDSSASHKHFSANVFRAVESRKAVIVAANTGVSAIIDASGRIVSESKLCEQAIISGTFLQNEYMTFYMRYGDVFVKFCIFIIIVFVFVNFYKRRLNGRE